jgi:endonuclease YncB( thermonuclease family)
VTRIVDANTLRLKKTGQVTLAAIQMPSPINFQFPDCFDKEPSYKLRRILPVGTVVRTKVVPSSRSDTTTVLVVKEKDGGSTGILVNAALVQTGFAKVKGGISAKAADEVLPGLVTALQGLSRQAKEDRLGIYQSCDDDDNNNSRRTSLAPMASFEPLDGATKTTQSIPPNPGNRRNCADFEYFEEAFSYYDRFYPYYGDVARLDRDIDGRRPLSRTPPYTQPGPLSHEGATSVATLGVLLRMAMRVLSS